MSKLGKFLRHLWLQIAGIFHKIEDEVKVLVPIAIKVVQGIKSAMNSPVEGFLENIIKGAIPGDADDKLITKIHTVVALWVPKVLLELNLVQSVADEADLNIKLQLILDQLKLASDETKNIFYHGLASLILEKLSDGKFDWSDATAVAEYYYQHELQNAAA